MNSTEQRIQVLYELSLSVGAKGNLKETARTALSAYLRKLNCSAGAVLERRHMREGGVSYEPVAMIPSRAAICDGLEAAIARLPDGSSTDETFLGSLPIIDQSGDEATYYVMELPDFGVIAIAARKQSLSEETVASLGPLNEKLATACRGERYEQRLRAERDRFETIFATIDEPLASVRHEGDQRLVQRINPAFERTFGHDETAALGRPLSELLDAGPADTVDIPPLDSDRGTDSMTTRIRSATADGPGEFLFRTTPINPETDGAEHLVLLVDVTEAATRQRQIEQFHDVTQALSRILRHNIRNDLTVIQAMAERITDAVDGPVAEDAERILQKSEQLASTAEKAREMRNLVTTDDQQAAVPLRTVVTDAVAPLRGDYPDADIAVDVTATDEVTIDPSIGIAVRHLVENGIEHYRSPDHDALGTDGDSSGPRVAVSAQSSGEGCAITVDDNGPGIPDAEVKMLRRPSETKLEHGQGAGLWIVSQIIDYCDADIAFSVTESGTTATITVQK